MAPSTRSRAEKHAEEIFREGLRAASPHDAVKKALARLTRKSPPPPKASALSLNLDSYKNIYLIGAGKAACQMAQAAEEALGRRITGGCVVTKYGHLEGGLKTVEVMEAAHPVPDEAGAQAAGKVLKAAGLAGKGDLVIFLLSGGASALLAAPALGVSLGDKQRVTELLVNSGAAINEINAVRKHLSDIKGGALARAAHPASVLSLIVSDVVGDDLSAIGSGPTAPDPTTFKESLSILERHGLTGRTPQGVLKRLRLGVAGRLPETPKPGDRIFKHCRSLIVANNFAALDAARKKAVSLGYRTLLLTSSLTGHTHCASRMLTSVMREVRETGNPVRPPACILIGGETTLKVRGKGKGGRNQELALASAIGLDGVKGATLLCAGTDGTDGPTDAAGAFADGGTVRRAKKAGLDAEKYLADNNSYRFFERLKGLLKTGPTGTNVMDMAVALVY